MSAYFEETEKFIEEKIERDRVQEKISVEEAIYLFFV